MGAPLTVIESNLLTFLVSISLSSTLDTVDKLRLFLPISDKESAYDLVGISITVVGVAEVELRNKQFRSRSFNYSLESNLNKECSSRPWEIAMSTYYFAVRCSPTAVVLFTLTNRTLSRLLSMKSTCEVFLNY